MRIQILFTHALSILKGSSLFVLASTFASWLEHLIDSVACFLQALSSVIGNVEVCQAFGTFNVWRLCIRVNKAFIDSQSRWQTNNSDGAFRIWIDSIELLVQDYRRSESHGTSDQENCDQFKTLADLFAWTSYLEIWTVNFVIWILIVEITDWFGEFKKFKQHLYPSGGNTGNESISWHGSKHDDINPILKVELQAQLSKLNY